MSAYHIDAETQAKYETESTKPGRPADKAIIECVSAHWGVSYGTACDWIIATSESIQQRA